MKIVLRLLLLLFILLILTIGTGFFVLTRPGVQKSLIERQLPEGSSLRTVRITTNSLELTELKLSFPDGSRLRLEALDADFKPLSALFSRALVIGELHLDGLILEVPEVILAGADEPVSTGSSGEPAPVAQKDPALEMQTPLVSGGGAAASESPLDALYALGQLDWLFDIESIRIAGELRDGGGSRYALEMSSGAIRPGAESLIEAGMQLRSGAALLAGLQSFDASVRLFLKQNQGGGFERLRLESVTNASDAAGHSLLSASQQLELELDAFEERATIQALFNADLPRPEIIRPEMADVGQLALQGSFSGETEGRVATLTGAELLMASGSEPVLQVNLKQSFSFGAQEDLTGDLMDVALTNLPLAWLRPWLPSGYRLYGEELSARLNLTGGENGELALRALAPIRLGPVSLDSGTTRLLDELTVSLMPALRIASDQSIQWDLGEFEIADRLGPIVSGSSTGTLDPTAPRGGFLPAGLWTRTEMEVALRELSRQPMFTERFSLAAGRATARIDLDPGAEAPVMVQGRLLGVSPVSRPGTDQDYRVALEISELQAGEVALRGDLSAGPENRPSSDLQFSGRVSPESSPLRFDANLEATRLSQEDLTTLQKAFSPGDRAPAPVALPEQPASGILAPASAGGPLPQVAELPPWAGYDGQLRLSIEELLLASGDLVTAIQVAAIIAEPLLRLERIEASVEGGRLEGSGELRFSSQRRNAYGIQTELNFENLDPAIFAHKRSGSFPVRGLFNGTAQFTGNGPTLDAAINDLEGELLVTGREGVLTAFELDNRSQLGLIGAGILGQKLNRPGIAAMAEAVPYFKDMRFSDFILRLNRGSDKRLMIPELYFKGDHLLINGSGFIAATRLSEIMDQPLKLSLELGAKGRLVDSLETLQLLGPNTSEDGYRRWNRAIRIGGTLGDPDTTALKRLLNEAAQRALRGPSEPAGTESAENGSAQVPDSGAPTESTGQSKADRIREDIQTGAEVIHLLFGN